jgi:hypothetical protein
VLRLLQSNPDGAGILMWYLLANLIVGVDGHKQAQRDTKRRAASAPFFCAFLWQLVFVVTPNHFAFLKQ